MFSHDCIISQDCYIVKVRGIGKEHKGLYSYHSSASTLIVDRCDDLPVAFAADVVDSGMWYRRL